MGLLDWFKSAAGAAGDRGDISAVKLDQGESAEVAGLDFQAAVSAHQKWKTRLQACIDGTNEEKLDAEVIGRDDQCVLGKWIYGEGMATFGEGAAFKDLQSAHAEFHRVAAMVLNAVYDGRKEEAGQLLASRFSQASVRVLGLLANLFVQARG
ncbi:MAG TPA: CZB domain-containing protein [Gallionellaceae bacterium]|nr:CZB domain-containing protein [Gallionellaceae bacterium]